MARVYFDINGDIVAEGHGITSRVKDERYRLLEKAIKDQKRVIFKMESNTKNNHYPKFVFKEYIPLYISPLYLYHNSFSTIDYIPLPTVILNPEYQSEESINYLKDLFKDMANKFLEREYERTLKTVDDENIKILTPYRRSRPTYIFVRYPLYNSDSIELLSDSLSYFKRLNEETYEFDKLTEKERELFKEAIKNRIPYIVKEIYKSEFILLANSLRDSLTKQFLLLGVSKPDKIAQANFKRLISEYYWLDVKKLPLKVDQTISMVEDPEETYALLRLEETSPELKKEIEEERKRTEEKKIKLLESFVEDLNALIRNYREAFEQYKNMGIININGRRVKGKEVKLEDLKRLYSLS